MPSYTIVLDPDLDDGGYTVTVPTLPGVVTRRRHGGGVRGAGP
jgi:predicted RNase H-like HicB family nuclease